MNNLFNFYHGNCPECFKQVIGRIHDNIFTVGNHKEFYFPLRKADGRLIHWGVIKANQWTGLTFYPVVIRKPAKKSERFTYGKGRY